ncbi:putative short chain dehydrogenase [Trichinella spiralis]|nr:putative short chain dehydrogenase [Trichinella spiralis]
MDDIVNDIHCDKQENSDDSDTDTATVESIPLKTYPELNDCVDHLERFIEATESADEGIVKAISTIQFVKDHRPKRVRQPWKTFSPEVKRKRYAYSALKTKTL